MEIGKRYVVTKESDDGTFYVGDHFIKHTNGSIDCQEAQGWVEASEVQDAIKGMEFAIDIEWYVARKATLEKQLLDLSNELVRLTSECSE